MAFTSVSLRDRIILILALNIKKNLIAKHIRIRNAILNNSIASRMQIFTLADRCINRVSIKWGQELKIQQKSPPSDCMRHLSSLELCCKMRMPLTQAELQNVYDYTGTRSCIAIAMCSATANKSLLLSILVPNPSHAIYFISHEIRYTVISQNACFHYIFLLTDQHSPFAHHHQMLHKSSSR